MPTAKAHTCSPTAASTNCISQASHLVTITSPSVTYDTPRTHHSSATHLCRSVSSTVSTRVGPSVRTSTRRRRCGSPRLAGMGSVTSWPTCCAEGTQRERRRWKGECRSTWRHSLRPAPNAQKSKAVCGTNHPLLAWSKLKVPRARLPGSSSTRRCGCAGSSQA